MAYSLPHVPRRLCRKDAVVGQPAVGLQLWHRGALMGHSIALDVVMEL